MLWQRLSRASIGLAMILLVLAVALALQPAHVAAVFIPEPEREFRTCPVGGISQLTFRVENPARYPARVVGLSEC